MKVFCVPFTPLGFFTAWAKSGSWSITNKREQEHVIRIGIVTEKREKNMMYSIIIGPFSCGFMILK